MCKRFFYLCCIFFLFYFGVLLSSFADENSGDPVITSNYVKTVSGIIKKNWNPSYCYKSYSIVASFDVLRNGKINKISILRSSGDNNIDGLATQAIKISEPLPPIPDAVEVSKKTNDITMIMSFDYTVAPCFKPVVKFFPTDDILAYMQGLSFENKKVLDEFIVGFDRDLSSRMLPLSRYFYKHMVIVSFCISGKNEISDFQIEKHSLSEKFDSDVARVFSDSKVLCPRLSKELGVSKLRMRYKIYSGTELYPD